MTLYICGNNSLKPVDTHYSLHFTHTNTRTFFFFLVRSGKFACAFDVFYYPFDLQSCSLLLQLSSARVDQAAFSQDLAQVVNEEQQRLPLFEVTQCVVTVVDAGTNETRFSVLKVGSVCVCVLG